MSIIDEQWKQIMEDNVFSEEGTVTTVNGDTFSASGVFYSGSYAIDKAASYGASRWERGDYFQISSLSLPASITEPAKELRNAIVVIANRGNFRVHQVKGALSGMLTLEIQPREFGNV